MDGKAALEQVDMLNVDVPHGFTVLVILMVAFQVVAYVFLRLELTRR